MSLPFDPAPPVLKRVADTEKQVDDKNTRPGVNTGFSPKLLVVLVSIVFVAAMLGGGVGVRVFAPTPPVTVETKTVVEPVKPVTVSAGDLDITVGGLEAYIDPAGSHVCAPMSVLSGASETVKVGAGDFHLFNGEVEHKQALKFKPDSTPGQVSVPSGAKMPLKACWEIESLNVEGFTLRYGEVEINVKPPAL